jgi:CelD/BcsL family acetyltransferase involved in cellulose biosynthesis
LVDIDVVGGPQGLEAMIPAWDALCDAAAHATPFQRPAWAIPWMRHMGAGGPRALALRCGRDLVGLLATNGWTAGGRRTLSLVGAGVSDHLDVLAAPGFEQTVLDATTEWLEGTREEWDECAFDEIGPCALLQGLRAPPGTLATRQLQSVCPVLTLPEGEWELERAVPTAQAARWRKAWRRADRVASVDLVRPDRGDLGEALRALFALHAKRWESRNQPGVLDAAPVRRLHEEAARAFAARGALRLYGLRYDGRYAAVVYGFREARRLHLYMQGIDPALERASPGTILVGLVVQDALREGVHQIDFLRGAEPYKYAWGASDEASVRLCIST